MSAFECLNEPPTRRRATTAARDYAPTETPQAEPNEFEGIPRVLIPVEAAPLSTRTKAAIAKMPEVAELQKIATEDNKVRELQNQFTAPAARAAFKASMSKAVESGDGEQIRALPSEAEQIASYQAAHRQLDEKLKAISKQALPYIERVTTKAIKLVIQDRNEAEAELAEVFAKRGLPAPPSNVVCDSYNRTAQNFQRDLEFHRGGITCNPLRQFLASVGVS